MNYQDPYQNLKPVPGSGPSPEFQPRLSDKGATNIYNPSHFALTGLLGGPAVVAAVALLNLRGLPKRVSTPTALISIGAVGIFFVGLIIVPADWWAESPRLGRLASQAIGGVAGALLGRVQQGSALFVSGQSGDYKSIWSLWPLLVPVGLIYAFICFAIMLQRGLIDLS